jgi:hypothetical protein
LTGSCSTDRDPSSFRRRRLLDGAAGGLLFLFGFALCLHHGRVGLMPLDQSIVFDGAWRLLYGQVPFRDFGTPAGLAPIALQALLFGAFGVSWFVYCLHAAIFNGLFCVLAFRLLRRLGAGVGAAALYGALGGVVFYPPFGVPYMEQHAFFFSLALVLALFEAGAGGSTPRWPWLSLPWLLAAAYLSKPIPTVFFLPLLAFVPVGLTPSRRRAAARPFLTSAAVLVAALGAAVLAVDRGLLLESLFIRPGREGRGRLLAMLEPAAFAGQASELFRAAAMLCLLPTVLGAVALLARRPDPGARTRELPHWWRPALALYLLAACAAFVMATDNQGENGVPFVFLAAGLVHGELLDRWRRPSGLPALVVASLAVTSTVDAVRFEKRVNVTRMVHELDGVASGAPSETRALPPALAFLEWRLHPFYRFGPGDLAAAVSFLRNEDGAIYVFGDLTLLYALTGRPSAGTTLWLHPGLTLPEPHEAAFAAWETRLLDDLARRRVRFVVRESRQTYNGLRLSDLPRLAGLIEARRKRRLSFGPIDVMELRP